MSSALNMEQTYIFNGDKKGRRELVYKDLKNIFQCNEKSFHQDNSGKPHSTHYEKC